MRIPVPYDNIILYFEQNCNAFVDLFCEVHMGIFLAPKLHRLAANTPLRKGTGFVKREMGSVHRGNGRTR